MIPLPPENSLVKVSVYYVYLPQVVLLRKQITIRETAESNLYNYVFLCSFIM